MCQTKAQSHAKVIKKQLTIYGVQWRHTSQKKCINVADIKTFGLTSTSEKCKQLENLPSITLLNFHILHGNKIWHGICAPRFRITCWTRMSHVSMSFNLHCWAQRKTFLLLDVAKRLTPTIFRLLLKHWAPAIAPFLTKIKNSKIEDNFVMYWEFRSWHCLTSNSGSPWPVTIKTFHQTYSWLCQLTEHDNCVRPSWPVSSSYRFRFQSEMSWVLPTHGWSHSVQKPKAIMATSTGGFFPSASEL